MSGGGIDQPTEAHSHTQQLDDRSPGFMKLVRAVEALKISRCTETAHARRMHKALSKIVLRMDMDAAVYKKNQRTGRQEVCGLAARGESDVRQVMENAEG
ncbi:hypothetical protein ACLOJK_019867 [Asimina triloba]